MQDVTVLDEQLRRRRSGAFVDQALLAEALRQGQEVLYWSSTYKQWMPTVIQQALIIGGELYYDLDCKPKAVADKVKPRLEEYRVGDKVSYWSGTHSQWMQGVVKAIHSSKDGKFWIDLDIKPKADGDRIFQPGKAPLDAPPADLLAQSPRAAPPPAAAVVAGGPDAGAGAAMAGAARGQTPWLVADVKELGKDFQIGDYGLKDIFKSAVLPLPAEYSLLPPPQVSLRAPSPLPRPQVLPPQPQACQPPQRFSSQYLSAAVDAQQAAVQLGAGAPLSSRGAGAGDAGPCLRSYAYGSATYAQGGGSATYAQGGGSATYAQGGYPSSSGSEASPLAWAPQAAPPPVRSSYEARTGERVVLVNYGVPMRLDSSPPARSSSPRRQTSSPSRRMQQVGGSSAPSNFRHCEFSELRMNGPKFDMNQRALADALLRTLQLPPSTRLTAMQGFRGGMNQGIWFAQCPGREELVLKLVQGQRVASSIMTEAENIGKLQRDFPELTRDPLVAFPGKVVGLRDPSGVKRQDIIAMCKVPGESLGQWIATKWMATASQDRGKVMEVLENLAAVLADFHRKYGNTQHGDFTPSNVYFHEASSRFYFIDIGGMGIPTTETDVEHFVRSCTLLAESYGPEFAADSKEVVERGYQRAMLGQW